MNNIYTVEKFNSKIKRVLIEENAIRDAISKVGKEISKSYDGRPILLVSILKGAFVFLADLCRAIDVPCEIAFMRVKSYYEGTESSGNVKILMDLLGYSDFIVSKKERKIQFDFLVFLLLFLPYQKEDGKTPSS